MSSNDAAWLPTERERLSQTAQARLASARFQTEDGSLTAFWAEVAALRNEVAQTLTAHATESNAHELLAWQTELHQTLDEHVAQAVETLLAARLGALTEQASRDPLTGLFNRATFEQRLRNEIERARRYGREFALVLFDVDGLKTVNDRFGHPAGDQVLRYLAQMLRSSLRQSDDIFRLGGDEFAALCPETSRPALENRLPRLEFVVRQSNGNAPWADHWGLSWGVASLPAEVQEAEALLALADQRLYECKRAHHQHAAARR